MSESRTREEVLRKESKEVDVPVTSLSGDQDRKPTFRRLGLARMKREWTSEESVELASINELIQKQMLKTFGDAYQLMEDLYSIVRDPEVNEHGEILTDEYGLTVWRRSPSGGYEEDWHRLTNGDLKMFLFRLTTSLFAWKQSQANMWAEAMYSKAAWEEALALGYDESKGKTVEDRTQAGRLASREERYFGIFLAVQSRKADSLVNSMEHLSQRLKDCLAA